MFTSFFSAVSTTVSLTETGSWTLLFCYVVGALSMSFLCSLLEAVVMSVDVFKLNAMAREAHQGAIRMLQIKEQTADAIAAILTLNTISHTVGATLAGAEALALFGNAWMGVFSGILTLLILVLTEIIPKNWGERHPESLAGFASSVLQVIIKLMMPLVKVNRVIVLRLFGEEDELIERSTVTAIHEEAVEDGAINQDEYTRISRLLALSDEPIKNIMVSRLVAPMISSSMTLQSLESHVGINMYHRALIFEGDDNHVIGYIVLDEAYHTVLTGLNQRETLIHDAIRMDDTEESIPLIRQVFACSEESKAGQVLNKMLQKNYPILLVHDDSGTSVGMITIDEFFEFIINREIRDEDTVLQSPKELEAQRKEKRLRQLNSID